MAHSTVYPAGADTHVGRPALPTIPLRELAPFALFGSVLALLLLYVVGVEQGAVSLVGGSYVHEFVHDARHLLGFACH